MKSVKLPAPFQNDIRTSHRTEHSGSRKHLRDNLVTPHTNNHQLGVVPLAGEWRKGRWIFQNVSPADHDELWKRQSQRQWRRSRHGTRSQNEPSAREVAHPWWYWRHHPSKQRFTRRRQNMKGRRTSWVTGGQLATPSFLPSSIWDWSRRGADW